MEKNMQFHAKTIREKAKKDFEKTWLETAKLLKVGGRGMYWPKSSGQKHSLHELNNKFREIFLSYGFNEVELPSIVAEQEVYKQYGPEAPLILDRVFYLAGLPRKELDISKEKKEQIKKIPAVLTLRSHMSASWFSLLAKMQRTHKLPLKLFSIGKRYRREQKQDAYHLYESTSASIVVMAQGITLEDGKDLTRKILQDLRFEKNKIIPKKTTSKYYAPGTDLEVYIAFKGKEIEVANLGFYSPVPLAKYKIWYPVLNLGFGVERVAMVLNGVNDIRKLVYPEIYE